MAQSARGLGHFVLGIRSASRAAFALLCIHAVLLVWMSFRNGPVYDELGHISAGMSHWRFGRFDLYCVNPPLIRMLATVPVLLSNPRMDWSLYKDGKSPTSRREFALGRQFVQLNQNDWPLYFAMARWALIPLSVMGGWICFRWAFQLYGTSSGLMAVALWSFSPNILAWGATFTPDAGATAFGLAAAYAFWQWLQQPDWFQAFKSGSLLGVALLCKTTWLLLLFFWPMLWFASNWRHPRAMGNRRISAELAQLAGTLLVSLFVVNLGYGFNGSFCKLDTFSFSSSSLSGSETTDGQSGNRFRTTFLGSVPLPFPKDYVIGLDTQKADFEQGNWSYLNGHWKKGGWWYYYAYVLLWKVPIGTWVLLLIATGMMFTKRGDIGDWRNELVLLAPVIMLFVVASSQSGISRHLRYLLPVFPFVFIWMSKVARYFHFKQNLIASISSGALAWSIVSSLWAYPHSLSYFNELAGGPLRGHAYVVHSNIDWGQDLFYLKRWLHEHTEAEPLGLAYYGTVNPHDAQIEYTLPPTAVSNRSKIDTEAAFFQEGPQPGWYAISINYLRGYPGGKLTDKQTETFEDLERGDYTYFLRFQPIARAGYSIWIFHVTRDEANRLRAELGLPVLAG